MATANVTVTPAHSVEEKKYCSRSERAEELQEGEDDELPGRRDTYDQHWRRNLAAAPGERHGEGAKHGGRHQQVGHVGGPPPVRRVEQRYLRRGG
jgi:hypothetical protein